MINAEKKNNFNLIRYAVLTIMYTVAYNSYFRSISILWYGISLLSIFMLAASVLVKKTIK